MHYYDKEVGLFHLQRCLLTEDKVFLELVGLCLQDEDLADWMIMRQSLIEGRPSEPKFRLTY